MKFFPGTNSLASIPSSGSLSSNPETLKPSSKRVNGRGLSGLPQRTGSLQSKNSSRPSSARPTTLNRNGRLGTTSSASNSPRRGHPSTNTPPPEGRITREDLRRMNRSYPNPSSASSGRKPEATNKIPKRPTTSSTSFSRASIPMS